MNMDIKPEIVSLATMQEEIKYLSRGRPPVNLTLMDSLDFDKAYIFRAAFVSKEKAQIKGMSFCGSSRSSRRNYKVHYRVLPSAGDWSLYVWKETK